MTKTDAVMALSGTNADYIAHLYACYLKSPSSVDSSWQDFFSALNDNESELLKEMTGASWTPEENRRFRGSGSGMQDANAIVTSPVVERPHRQAERGTEEEIRRAALDAVRALMLIRAYRARGHLIADLDPLQLKEKEYHPELDPAHYGFRESDYDRPIFLNGVLGYEYASLREILAILKETYCHTIGVEFLHLSDPEEKSWIQKRIENIRNHTDFTINGRRAILHRLTAAEVFETYLHKKYPGTKRFGIDGGEALIPAIEQIMKRGGQLGLKEIVLGMAHRGRLNVLANVMGKPFSAIFAEFHGLAYDPENVQGSGDVKYHLGTSSDRDFDGNCIHLSLTANPSHLEAVNPVVIGKVRAKQQLREDRERTEVLPLLLHGDAAFAGQGLVAETLMISELPGYRVGGTIHIVINNQIGFTTMPKYGRSGPYPTDVAKMLAAPIFHVNGDDPEAVVHVSRIATEFRQEFGKDVVIDLYCYRRFGHNEGDEPSFTQPMMYKKIAEHESARTMYARKLIEEKVVTERDAEEFIDDYRAELEKAYEASNNYEPNDLDFLGGEWEGFSRPQAGPRRGDTGITMEEAQHVGKALTTVPDGFNLHKKLGRFMDARRKMFETGEDFDWSTAEALAFGSLQIDGYRVRLSGQDSGRGTFSQRHAVLYDQEQHGKYRPLQNVVETPDMFEVHNSPLSEQAVLGFEYGYSLSDPNTLTIWEAQFGDFANGAQVIIDQFISSGEAKWLRMSGLVLLLPHGYEGQGPEHSSARLERFLQLSGDDNWQVCNCTTPANYFHVLRRQMCRNFRKPLVLMTPKSLLRHKLAVSKLTEMTEGSSFHRVLWDHDYDELAAPNDMKRVVFCSGKVYYDLLQARREKDIKDVILIRLEQLFPFPKEVVAEEIKRYPGAEIVWCQEEPRNQGAWAYMGQRFEDVLTELGNACGRARYVGRGEMASTATGSLKRHNEEQAALVDEALRV